ncbi:MAG: hypothetical protein JJE52_16745 [Acidimicrobiia bacterium]|nr:hypothetical protein [Acidimicrobiia bacterium]
MSGVERDRALAKLGAWVRRHPEVWPHGDATPMTDEHMDELVDGILARTATRSDLARRRRRRVVAGGVCVAVAITGGVAAAALVRSGQPSAPHQGALCRVEADLDASAIAVVRGDDPIEGCEQLWNEGQFVELGGPSGVPPLAACIGPNGAVEVFPGEPTVCEELGLAVADPELSSENVAILELNDRLVNEINAVECVPVEEAATTAERIVDESPLAGWNVVITPEAKGGACGMAGLDPEAREVFIFNLHP